MGTDGIQNAPQNVTVLKMCGLTVSGGAKVPTRITLGTNGRRNALYRDVTSLLQTFPSGVAVNDSETVLERPGMELTN